MTSQSNSQKNAYKIKPDRFLGLGSHPASAVLRTLALAENIIGLLGAILIFLVSLPLMAVTGGASFPVGTFTGFAVAIIFSNWAKANKYWASLIEIDGLISDLDKRHIEELINVNKTLALRMSKYKTVGEMPASLREDISKAINNQVYTMRTLKEAVAAAKYQAGKSLMLYNAQVKAAKKSVPHSDRRLI